MEKLLQWMEYIEDVRQEKKVRHKLKDILVIVMFATLADADDWVEIAEFAEVYEDYLKKYISLENGVPSHDTIQRVMGMVSPEALQQLYIKWQGLLDSRKGMGKTETGREGFDKAGFDKARKKMFRMLTAMVLFFVLFVALAVWYKYR